VCNKLVCRSLFAETGIAFPPGRDFEDLATAYRLCGEAKRIEKVAEPIYRYRLGQPSSIMGACDERFLQIFDALVITNEHFRRREIFDALRDDLETVNFVHALAGRLPDLLRYADAETRARFIAAAFAHMDEWFAGWRHDAVVRAASGSTARHAVLTSPWLLRAYTAWKAVPKR
jgi:hypothetical protein